MRSYTTRLAFTLLILTIIIQLLIAWGWTSINSSRKSQLFDLQYTATNQWISTAAFIAENPLTLTPTPSATLPIPTSTPTSCLAEVASTSGTIYIIPAQGRTVNSLSVTQGDSVTLIGKLKDEPWWRVYFPQTFEIGWIEIGKFNEIEQCNNLADLDLSFMLESKDSYKVIIQDTFNGFDNEWRDKDGNPIERPVTNGYAQMHLDDRSSLKASEEVAILENIGIPTPFGFIISINPFSFDNNSYLGFRYRSASDPGGSWIQFKLIRKNCAVEWEYSINGEITKNPSFTLGESAGCSNDKIADYLNIDTIYNSDTDAMRITGTYNDATLPLLTIFDRSKILQTGSFELLVSKSDILFNYIVVYQPK